MESKAILNEIKKAVKSVDGDAQVILFGSRARGDNRPDSDWDLLILPQKEISLQLEESLRDVIYDLELEYEEVFSMFLFPRAKWNQGASPSPLYDNIRKEGVAI